MTLDAPSMSAEPGRSASPREDAPAVTLVVACYKHERFVRQALEAVAAQTYPHIFLIVTDDASPDSSVDVIQDFLDQYEGEALFIRNEQNIGLCATLNLVRRQLQGTYVAFIAADDWMEPQRIERQVAELEAQGRAFGLCYSDAYLADESGTRLSMTYHERRGQVDTRPSGFVFTSLLQANFIPATSALIRRAALDDAGPYDERLHSEDRDMWLRISRKWQVACVAEPLVTYRDVDGSLSKDRDPKRSLEEALIVMGKHLGQRDSWDDLLRPMMIESLWKLYRQGNSPRSTSRRLMPLVRRTPQPRFILFLIVASTGVNGEILDAVLSRRHRQRATDGRRSPFRVTSWRRPDVKSTSAKDQRRVGRSY